jgi:hypothetical protein
MARLVRRTVSSTSGDFARIPATKTTPVATSTTSTPAMSLPIIRPMATSYWNSNE